MQLRHISLRERVPTPSVATRPWSGSVKEADRLSPRRAVTRWKWPRFVRPRAGRRGHRSVLRVSDHCLSICSMRCFHRVRRRRSDDDECRPGRRCGGRLAPYESYRGAPLWRRRLRHGRVVHNCARAAADSDRRCGPGSWIAVSGSLPVEPLAPLVASVFTSRRTSNVAKVERSFATTSNTPDVPRSSLKRVRTDGNISWRRRQIHLAGRWLFVCHERTQCRVSARAIGSAR